MSNEHTMYKPNQASDSKPRTATQGLLLTADQCATLCSVSPASWHRWNSAGRCPKCIRIGGTVRWARTTIERWIELGCPAREIFEAQAETRS